MPACQAPERAINPIHPLIFENTEKAYLRSFSFELSFLVIFFFWTFQYLFPFKEEEENSTMLSISVLHHLANTNRS